MARFASHRPTRRKAAPGGESFARRRETIPAARHTVTVAHRGRSDNCQCPCHNGNGQAISFGGSIDQGLLRRHLLVHGAAGGQRVGHFPEGALNHLLVLGHGDFRCTLAALCADHVRASKSASQSAAHSSTRPSGLKSPERSLLEVPIAASGKFAGRMPPGRPMSALAALSRSSACSTSGRRRSTSEDRPGEISSEE